MERCMYYLVEIYILIRKRQGAGVVNLFESETNLTDVISFDIVFFNNPHFLLNLWVKSLINL